ncbi:MAG: Alpha/beta hydrolase family protein [Pelotomaculum sp. PtaU1.Bin035]|nr:MAG: Alpha/beta hydrolase family protein [Pelotomaculum sp. PtaU1.Bin035]
MTKPFIWKKVGYQNKNGLKLSGLLFAGPENGTVVIVCHGFTGSKEGGGRAVAMAEEMGARGYATLLFDFSGCGESEGDFADVSLTGHIADIKCTVDFCLGLGFSRVIAVGRSFGGTAAICQGGADGRVAGVCAWAAPGALRDVFSGFLKRAVEAGGDMVPLSEEEDAGFIKKSFISDLERHDVFGQAALIAPRPLLLIQGSNDQVVPVENAQAIYNAAGEPKKIRIIQEADHQFTGFHLEAWEALFEWLEENFSMQRFMHY